MIPRGSLITLLESGLPEGTVQFGARLAELREDEDGVRVRTHTGQEYSGDFLVGADSVHSRVRALVVGGGKAALASTVASRSLAVSGPRTLTQSEYLMRMNGAAPPGLATRGFGRLLRALSSRI